MKGFKAGLVCFIAFGLNGFPIQSEVIRPPLNGDQPASLCGPLQIRFGPPAGLKQARAGSMELPGRRGDYFRNPTGFSAMPKKRRAMGGIIDDFLVNDDTSGGAAQSSAAIAAGPSGNFVVTWQDSRNGSSDIYAQRYDSSGTAVDSNIKVNDDTGASEQSRPAVALDGWGDFVITWEDTRNGNSDIYAQRFDWSGMAGGSNFKVNDDIGAAQQRFPSVAMDGSGNFGITWEDPRHSNYDIYAQRYDSSGTALGVNFVVNDDTGTASQQYASVAMDGSGDFVISWRDLRHGNYDIYAQRYSSGGITLGSNFKVNDDTGTAQQHFPAVALDGSGGFAVTWQDLRNGDFDIYAQRYNTSGITLDSNFKVSDDITGNHQMYPAIAMHRSGSFVITWQDSRNFGLHIYAQRFDPANRAIGSNFQVNDDAGSGSPSSPALAMDSSGDFVIAWDDSWTGIPYIYLQRYDSSGTAIGSNFKLDDNAGLTDQETPGVAIDGFGNFVLAWLDKRNNIRPDVYAQRFDYSGAVKGSNFKVNQAGSAYFSPPSLAIDGSGNFFITWLAIHAGNYDIYVQRYDSSGTPVCANVQVNDDTGPAWQWGPDVVADLSGNYVITWEDWRIPSDIYAQRYHLSGTPLGSNFKINDDVGTRFQYYPAIAMDYSSNFVITWADFRNDYWDIYAQRFNSSGTALGSNFKVNDVAGSPLINYSSIPAVAMNSSGDFVIAWQDYRIDSFSNGNWYIIAQRYNSLGTALGSNFEVNDDIGVDGQTYMGAAINSSGEFIIAWQDSRNGNPDIYAQRYDSSGKPVGKNFLAPDSQYSSFPQQQPAVAANDSQICFTWQDRRRGKGWDIYAKVVDWKWGACTAIPGDANASGLISLGDIVHLVNYILDRDRVPCLGTDPGNCWTPDPICRGDVNASGSITLGDVIALVNFIFDKDRLPCRGIDPGNCWSPESNGTCCLPAP